MSIDVIDIVRVEGGLMVEHWGVPDRLGALFQLGLAELPGAAGPSGSPGRPVSAGAAARAR